MCWWRRFLSDVQNHTQSAGRSPLNARRLCKQNTRPYGQARRGRRSARLWCFADRQLLCLLRTRTPCRHTLYTSSLLLLLLYRTIRFSRTLSLSVIVFWARPLTELLFTVAARAAKGRHRLRTFRRPIFGYAVNRLIQVTRCYPTGNAVLQKVCVLSYRRICKRNNIVNGNGFRRPRWYRRTKTRHERSGGRALSEFLTSLRRSLKII